MHLQSLHLRGSSLHSMEQHCCCCYHHCHDEAAGSLQLLLPQLLLPLQMLRLKMPLLPSDERSVETPPAVAAHSAVVQPQNQLGRCRVLTEAYSCGRCLALVAAARPGKTANVCAFCVSAAVAEALLAHSRGGVRIQAQHGVHTLLQPQQHSHSTD